jgi:hypothetical protein
LISPRGSGVGSGGSIIWNYGVDESNLSNLTANQTVTDSFVVTLRDTSGATSQQTITISLRGTGVVSQLINLTTSADAHRLGLALQQSSATPRRSTAPTD